MRRELTTLSATVAALVVSAVVAAAWVLVAPPARAAFPGDNGRIVFHNLDSD